MRDQVRAFIRIASQAFVCDGPVYHLGSRLWPEEEDGGIRHLFSGRTFIGVDERRGTGVDRLEELHQLSLPDASAGTVVCLERLECVFDVLATMREVVRVLKPGGIFIVATLLDTDRVGLPSDYWRITPNCMARMMSPFDSRLLGWHGIEGHPHTVYAVGARSPACDRFAHGAEQFMTTFQRWTADEYAARPWQRRLHAKLHGWLAGRRWRVDQAQSRQAQFALHLPDRMAWQRGLFGKPHTAPMNGSRLDLN